MLGLFLILFLGGIVLKLAEKKGRNKWLWAIISVAAYYLGTFMAGIGWVIIMETDVQELGLGGIMLLSLISGLVGWGTVYLILHRMANISEGADVLDNTNWIDSNHKFD